MVVAEPATNQQILADAALRSFRLNGQFLTLAEELAKPAGLTAARWQILGAALSAPASVSEIARAMGLTRQSVQRIADLLVTDGLATYEDNPAHRRAKLVRVTDAGKRAVKRIQPQHRKAADALVAHIGLTRAESILAGLDELSAALDELAVAP